MQTVIETLPDEFKMLEKAIYALSKLLLHRRLFPAGYPSLDRMLGEAFMRLDTFLQRKKSVTLRLEGGFLCYLNFEMDIVHTDVKFIHLLRETLKRMSVGEIEIFNGITKEELGAFIDILLNAMKKERSGEVAAAWSKIEHLRIRHGAQVESGKRANRRSTGEKNEAPPEIVKTENVRSADGMIEIVDGVLRRLEKIQSEEGMRAGKKVLELVEHEGRNTSTILLLNSLRKYDDYTFTHSVNVAVISAAIARRLGYDDRKIDSIALAALMHDMGKVYVPREIIHKEGRLTPREWQFIKKHPVDGERLLREEGQDILSRRVAYEHHMRYDMQGYPVPRGEYETLDASQIVRIVDSYDALTTRRPYRKQISPYEAIKLMVKTRGKEFHPDFFDVFLRVLGNIPIGSILKLNTGETVLVVDISSESGGLPRVRVLKDARGRGVEEEIILDLNEIGSERKLVTSIVDNPVRDVDVGKYLVAKT